MIPQRLSHSLLRLTEPEFSPIGCLRRPIHDIFLVVTSTVLAIVTVHVHKGYLD